MPAFEVTAVRRADDGTACLAKVNDQPLLRIILRSTKLTRKCPICGAALAPGEEAFRPALDSSRQGVVRNLRFCVPCIEAGPDA
jgi:hypothetical protein